MKRVSILLVISALLSVVHFNARAEPIKVYPMGFNYSKNPFYSELDGSMELVMAFKFANVNILEFDKDSTLKSIKVVTAGTTIDAEKIRFAEPFKIGNKAEGGRLKILISQLAKNKGNDIKISGVIHVSTGHKDMKLLDVEEEELKVGESFMFGKNKLTVKNVDDNKVVFETSLDPSDIPSFKFKTKNGLLVEGGMTSQSTTTIMGQSYYTKTIYVDEAVSTVLVAGMVDVASGKVLEIPFEFNFIAPY